MSMLFKTLVPILFAFLFCTQSTFGQTKTPPTTIDSLRESHIASLKIVGVTDTIKAIVRVQVREIGSPSLPIQGATVVLRRDKDKMLGRVTKADGRCNFIPLPAEYAVRVQLTGYKTLDKGGLVFEGGKVYELELRIARN